MSGQGRGRPARHGRRAQSRPDPRRAGGGSERQPRRRGGNERVAERGRGMPPVRAEEVSSRLAAALQIRAAAELPSGGYNEVWRLIHAEHDQLPGLYIDVWGPVALIRLRSEEWHSDALRAALVDGLVALGIQQHRWLIDGGSRHSGPQLQEVAEAWNREAAARGNGPQALTYHAHELGLRYELRLEEPFNPGLFFDMREVRATLRQRWEGMRVANLFAYTGAFSVALAERNDVTNVDSSARYLEWAKLNHGLNGVEARYIHEDAFAWLERARRRGDQYDAVILDPPVFSRGKRGHSRVFSLRKDFGRLIEDALAITAPDGELFVSTNYEQLSQVSFRSLVAGIGRQGQRVLQAPWEQPPDFPAPAELFHLKTALLLPERG